MNTKHLRGNPKRKAVKRGLRIYTRRVLETDAAFRLYHREIRLIGEAFAAAGLGTTKFSIGARGFDTDTEGN